MINDKDREAIAAAFDAHTMFFPVGDGMPTPALIAVYRAGYSAGAAAMRERAAKVADGVMPVGPSPIGPLHGAGIADACRWIAEDIRALPLTEDK